MSQPSGMRRKLELPMIAKSLIPGLAALASMIAPIAALALDPDGVVLNEVSPKIERRDLPSLLDQDGTPQGFVELFNAGDTAQSLTGWSLEADQGATGSWGLPAITLEPGDLLRIWTSGKDRSLIGSPLHADFALAQATSVRITDSLGASVDETPLAVPVDHSYGRCGPSWYYFDQPSPAALNPAAWVAPIVVEEPIASLTLGRPHEFVALPIDDEIWSSDHPAISALPNGEIQAIEDVVSPEARPTVELWSASLNASRKVEFTVVGWTANVSTLEGAGYPDADQILGADDLGVYFSSEGDLYRSADGMETAHLLGPLPVSLGVNAQLRTTPFGYLLRSGGSVYHSSDLSSWSHAFTAPVSSLRSGFDFYWNETTELGTVVLTEYSNQWSRRHAVHVGTFESNGQSSWQDPLVFSSINEGSSDPTLLDVAAHIHVAALDPYTGDLWVGTGDSVMHSRILTAHTGAFDFDLLGVGSQEWRTLAIWFSPTHVYWNMDTTQAQSVWRVPRSMRDPITGWPSITPELASGFTKPGIRYLVTADASGSRFPVAIGDTWKETTARALDADHRVRPMDDPGFDYRERVAQLDNGSHWFQLWVEDEQGEPVSIMAAAAEGTIRDRLGRVFGFKERSDGSVDVQELLAIASSPHLDPYVQLEPTAQDPLGFIYFEGRATGKKLYRMRLDWQEDDGSTTGGPSAAAQAVVPPSPAHCLIPIPEPSFPIGIGIGTLAVLARGQMNSLRSNDVELGHSSEKKNASVR